MKRTDFVGKTIGFWKVLSYDKKSRQYSCKCVCGKTKKIHDTNLIRGKSKSCGCQKKTQLRHGMSKSRPYRAWRNMINRCTNPITDSYRIYGARGISVCERWKLFDNFWEDMSFGYADNLTLDRINTDGNYEKSNCRWATVSEQMKNRRPFEHNCSNRVFFTHNGKTQCLKKWAEENKIQPQTVNTRIHKYGWSIEKALFTPVQKIWVDFKPL